jgi:hypothetical protein
MTIESWKFATQPALPRAPHVMLAAFSRGPLQGDAVLSASTFGAPSNEAFDLCTLRTIERRADPAWFDGWRQGSMRNIAKSDLEDLTTLDATDHVHVILSEPTAPSNLSYLQAAWALARYAVAGGASVVIDAHAMTFLPATRLQPVGAPLDVAREVRIVYETTSMRDDGAHAIHTRGLRKFGAPDIVALCTDRDARFVGHAMAELTDAVARGTDLATPKHTVQVAPGVTWYAVEDEHRLADILSLNNEARVLVDDTGHDLMGVLGRLPLPT